MFFGIASLALFLVCSYFFRSDKIALTKRRVCSVTFLIKKLTRSNVYINVRFSYKRVRISYKKIRNSNLLTFQSWLSEMHIYPHLFIVHPF